MADFKVTLTPEQLKHLDSLQAALGGAGLSYAGGVLSVNDKTTIQADIDAALLAWTMPADPVKPGAKMKAALASDPALSELKAMPTLTAILNTLADDIDAQ